MQKATSDGRGGGDPLLSGHLSHFHRPGMSIARAPLKGGGERQQNSIDSLTRQLQTPSACFERAAVTLVVTACVFRLGPFAELECKV